MRDTQQSPKDSEKAQGTPDRGAPPVSTGDVMLVQESLQVKGLYKGEIDGIPGSQTLRAVRSYKKQNNIPVNNRLNAEFISHLRSAT